MHTGALCVFVLAALCNNTSAVVYIHSFYTNAHVTLHHHRSNILTSTGACDTVYYYVHRLIVWECHFGAFAEIAVVCVFIDRRVQLD